MFRKSFNLIWDSFGYFLTCMGLDVLFFFALGFFTFPVSAKMHDLLLQITMVFAKGLQEVGRSETVLDVLFSAKTMHIWKPMILYMLLFMLITYIVYIIFQSLAWNFSLRIIKKKINIKKYIISFAIINLFWLVILIIYQILDLIAKLRAELNSVKGFDIMSMIINFILIIVIYFAVISYIKLDLKKSLIIGWKNYKTLLSIYVAIIAYFFLLNFILARLYEINTTFAVVAGIVLFIPAITWSRVLLALSIDKVK